MLRAPCNSEGLAAWAPGAWGLIHQLGRFDSDNGLISGDKKAGGGLWPHFPQALSRAQWLQRTLSRREVACIWPRSLLAWRPLFE